LSPFKLDHLNQKDDESGLEYAQARYYNTAHGRFTSIDPLTASANVKNPQTFNRYAYVINNPVNSVDPSGLLPDFMKTATNVWNDKEWLNRQNMLVLKEWVKDNDGRPLWVPHDEYNAKQTERSKYPLWTESGGTMAWNTPEGRVELDPNGPSTFVPQGWWLNGIPQGEVVNGNNSPINNQETSRATENPLSVGRFGFQRQQRFYTPDFVQVELDIPRTPIAVQLTYSRFGRFYLASGVYSGGSGANISAGYLSGGLPSPERLHGWIDGSSVGGFVSTPYFIGGGATQSSGETAAQIGLGIPRGFSFSVSATNAARKKRLDNIFGNWR
jgi:RHS repeat-associated protein